MRRATKCSIAIVVVGVVLVIFGFALGYGIFPAIVPKMVREELDMWNPESEGRKNFDAPPVPVYMKFYIFEVLNGEAVTSGVETPRLQERGPYAYKEIRTKQDVGNKTESECYIRAGQYKAYIFDEEMSCEGCSPDDNITVVNAPYIGLAASFRAKPYNSLAEQLFREFNLSSTTGSAFEDGQGFNEDYMDELFREVNVGEYLFSGWKHGVLKYFIDNRYGLLSSQFPPQITKEGFAVFNGKNATAKNEYYEIDTAYCNENSVSDYASSDMKNYVQIRQWGESMEKLSTDLNSTRWWKKNGGYKGSNICNDIQGTDGQQFHSDVQPEDRLWIFQTDLCRTMFLEYQDEFYVEGIPTYRFAPPPKALQVNTTQNIGFCKQFVKDVAFDECIKETNDEDILDLSGCFGKTPERPLINQCYDGILNISSCQKGAPVILSSPYFYQSPDFLREAVNMAKADPDKHETRLYIEPTVGMTIKLDKRIQINIPLLRDEGFELLKNVKDTLMPMLWLEESAMIDEANVEKLMSKVVTPTRIVTGVQWACVALGIVMILGVAVKFLLKK